MVLVTHGPPTGGPGAHRGRVPAVRPHDRCAVPTGGTPADSLDLGGHACADRAAPHPGCLRPPWVCVARTPDQAGQGLHPSGWRILRRPERTLPLALPARALSK